MAKYVLTLMFLGLLTLVFYYPNSMSDIDQYEYQIKQEKIIKQLPAKQDKAKAVFARHEPIRATTSPKQDHRGTDLVNTYPIKQP